MSQLNVAFFGTSDKSLEILQALNQNFSLKLTVTKGDTKVGRHREVRETEVKKWSKDNDIECLTLDSFKPPVDAYIIKRLEELEIKYVVVTDFSFIIPKSLTENRNFKILNIHFSLLPKYRGASPVQFAILNGDTETGITYQLLANKMDTGDIISQIPFPIAQEDTTGTLIPKMYTAAAKELPTVIKSIDAQKISQIRQDEIIASYTYSKTNPKSTLIYKEDARVDWSQDARRIYNLVRAFNPWPIAWTTIGELKGYTPKRDELNKLRLKIHSGTYQKDEFTPNKVQVEGGNIMNWKEFVNGYINQ
jgi:methionyl-tRNA formyltransferase